MSTPRSRKECEELLLELELNRQLQREDPEEFREKVDLAWEMCQEGELNLAPPRKEKVRTHGRPINAQVPLMGTHLPERQAALRAMRINVGLKVTFVREPSNPHDPNAVRVLTMKRTLFGLGQGKFLGYVERDMASRMAPRMDRGVRFEGEVERVWYADYVDDVDIKIRVRQLGD